MADTFSKKLRSEVMRTVRSHGNRSTELRMMEIFRSHGITGWRRHQKLPGKPDFVFRKERVAVFIDGCFWHSCPKHVRAPASNVEYWTAKLARNLARDRRVSTTLRRAGWTVVRVWEHSLTESARVASRLTRVLAGRPKRHRARPDSGRSAASAFTAARKSVGEM